MELSNPPASTISPWARLRAIDKVWLTTLTIAGLVLVITPEQFKLSMIFVGQSWLWMLPLIILAAGAAAYVKATGADQQIKRVFSEQTGKAIVLASVFGALSPFCSCGVIAIVAGMLRSGVPLAPVMAFWIASPIMDPEMFVLTAAMLGIPFAVVKTLSAILMGLLSGLLTHWIYRNRQHALPLRKTGELTNQLPQVDQPVWKFWRHQNRKSTFWAETRDNTTLLFKWLTLAFLLESLMQTYLPGSTATQWLMGNDWWTIPSVALIGAPLYLNGYAAIPLASELLTQGMMPGAVLAFLVGGGVTSIPAAMSVYALVRKPTFALYLLCGFLGATLMGLMYQLILSL